MGDVDRVEHAMSTIHRVEGRVCFDRAAPAAHNELCRAQCGAGGHITRRRLLLEHVGAHPTTAVAGDVNAFVAAHVLRDNASEGKRVRITVEVLD